MKLMVDFIILFDSVLEGKCPDASYRVRVVSTCLDILYIARLLWVDWS